MSTFVDALPDGFDSILRGAVDVHVHGQPDLSVRLANRGSDIEAIRLAMAYGVRGWVLKSHTWPTMDRAALLQELIGDTLFAVYGSVTLNPLLGPISPAVVELAAVRGARVVFLPTWGARADLARGGYIAQLLGQVSPSFRQFSATHAVDIVDPTGKLRPELVDVVAVCAQLGLSLASGHVSLEESVALAEHCADVSFDRLLVNHPLHYSDDPGSLRAYGELGAFVEFSAAPLLHPDSDLTIKSVCAAIESVGVEHVVLSSDVFSRWVPPEPECLRIFAEQLLYLGCAEEDLRTMLSVNPKKFLGLAPVAADAGRQTS